MNLSSIRRLIPILAVALAISPAFATPASSAVSVRVGDGRLPAAGLCDRLSPLASPGRPGAPPVLRTISVLWTITARARRRTTPPLSAGTARQLTRDTPVAQNNLGVIYANGQGVPQDYAAAASWYRKAADQGHAIAQNNLGSMYRIGQGVPQDYAAAVSWYRKAADQGYATAQNNLGSMYRIGQGVPQNYVQEHKWFSLSASRATRADVRELATKNRDIVAAEMTPQQIAAAQRLARDWKPK